MQAWLRGDIWSDEDWFLYVSFMILCVGVVLMYYVLEFKYIHIYIWGTSLHQFKIFKFDCVGLRTKQLISYMHDYINLEFVTSCLLSGVIGARIFSVVCLIG